MFSIFFFSSVLLNVIPVFDEGKSVKRGLSFFLLLLHDTKTAIVNRKKSGLTILCVHTEKIFKHYQKIKGLHNLYKPFKNTTTMYVRDLQLAVE